MSIIPSSNWSLDEIITIPKINQSYYIKSSNTLPTNSRFGDILYHNSKYYLYYPDGWQAVGEELWKKSDSNIYYTDGEVWIGSDTDLGDYILQVSGSTYLYGDVKFKGNTISGLISPPFPSSPATKSYVDSNFYPSSAGNQLSGAFWSHSSNSSIHFTKGEIYLNDLADTNVPSPTSGHALVWNGNDWIDKLITGGESVNWGTLSNGAGIQSFSVGISGGSATVSILFGNTDDTVASGSHTHTIDELSNVSITNPQSGQLLGFDGSNWFNIPPPITISSPLIQISAQQNINLTRFVCPQDKKVYLWHACASDISGNSVADLKVELLSGSTSIYSTSSNELQTGYPLATAEGQIEIRFAYSGPNANGYKYGNGFMVFSVF